jgi:mRNA interferase HigB
MHVVSDRKLREYGEKHANCRDALDSWYKVASKLDWKNLMEVQTTFPK